MRLIRIRKARDISDQELLDSVRTGDRATIEELYKRCRSAIVNYVMNNYGDEDEAEDIVQETVIDVYEKIIAGSFQLYANTQLATFMMGVAKRKWLNQCRKKGKLVRVDGEDLQLVEEESEWQIEEERFAQLKSMMEKLDEVCREILRQRYWLKRKFDEIELLKFQTVDAIKMRSSRCHKQLRTMYG